VTHIQYNREGDLLFSSAKSPTVCVWYSDNGERLGTYKGHSGAVWSFDLNRGSNLLLTGSADSTAKLFDIETGKEIHSWVHQAPVRWVSMAEGDKQFLTVTDQVMKKEPTIWIYDRSLPSPVRDIVHSSAKFYQAVWGPLNKNIYSCCEDSTVTVYDAQTQRQISQVKHHTKPVNSLSFSEDKSHFVTASHDFTAQLYDTRTLEHLKTYDTGKPVNAAVISPIKDHILLGGGQSASEVTTTRVDASQFRLRFFHKVFEEELGSIQGHFGPVNTLAFAPDGSFASGGEDGFVRVHNLEDQIIFSLGDEDTIDDDDL